jgi:hypothetical protein
MGHGISIWYTVYRYDYLPYRHGHAGYRYGIWPVDMGDDSIDMVILEIDMGHLVTLRLIPPYHEVNLDGPRRRLKVHVGGDHHGVRKRGFVIVGAHQRHRDVGPDAYICRQ